jgi:hypothetical protein
MSRARGFCAAERTLDIASSSPTMTSESEGNLTSTALLVPREQPFNFHVRVHNRFSNPLTSDLASMRISFISYRERCMMMFVLEVGAAISVAI